MPSEEFVNLIVESTRNVIEKIGKLKEIESTYKKLGGNYSNLTEPERFDNYSYLFFKSISKHITDSKTRDDITVDIGRKIYEFIKNKFDLKTGNSDDMNLLKNNLKTIIEYLKTSNYFEKAEISWNNPKEFFLIMIKPVILPAAQRLYKEEGFAQHYLSRTIEASLSDFGIRGRETNDFDPTKFPKERVVEKWIL